MITEFVKRIFLGMVLVTMVTSSLSCYTILKPPGGVTSGEDRYLGQGYYEEGIAPEYLWYDPFHSWYYPDAYARWRYYYGYPWWWNDYWYWHPSDGEGLLEDSDKEVWERRKAPDWYSPPSTSTPPSGASQPREQQKKSEEKPSRTVPQTPQRRSKPELRSTPERPPTPEQQTREKEKEEQAEGQATE